MHFLRVRPVSIPASSFRHFPFLPSIHYFPLSLSLFLSPPSLFVFFLLFLFFPFKLPSFDSTQCISLELHFITYCTWFVTTILFCYKNPSSISIITLFLTLVLSMSSVTLRNSTFIYEEQKCSLSHFVFWFLSSGSFFFLPLPLRNRNVVTTMNVHVFISHVVNHITSISCNHISLREFVHCNRTIRSSCKVHSYQSSSVVSIIVTRVVCIALMLFSVCCVYDTHNWCTTFFLKLCKHVTRNKIHWHSLEMSNREIVVFSYKSKQTWKTG